MVKWRALRVILVCAFLALSARPAMAPAERAVAMLVVSAERGQEPAPSAVREIATEISATPADRPALRATPIRVSLRKLYLLHCSLLA